MALCSRLLPSFRTFHAIQAVLREDIIRESSTKGRSLRHLTSALFQPLVIQGVDAIQLEAQYQVAGSSDNAFLEPLTEEYQDAAVEIVSAISEDVKTGRKVAQKVGHHNMTRVGLARRIKHGEWGVAEELRNEYMENGIHIQRHAIFALAAIRAWRMKSAEERTEAFYQWLRLLPNAEAGNIRQTRMALHGVKTTLFKKGPSDLDTIACCGIVAARKGYVNSICPDIVSHITRYSPPHISAAFFAEVEKSAKAFYARFSAKTKDESKSSAWNGTRFNNLYIRGLILAGYCDAAIQRVQYMVQQGLRVDTFSWSLLLQELKAIHREDLLAKLVELRASNASDEHSTDAISKRKAAAVFSASDLAQLFDEYIESGNVLALNQLKQDILQDGGKPDLWLIAQMKYYQMKGEPGVVLKLFLDHFMCIGASKRHIAACIRAVPDAKFHSLLPQVGASQQAIAGRWPTSHILTLVWSAIASLAKDKHEVMTLYGKFLRYFYGADANTSTTNSKDSRPWSHYRFQHPPATAPDTVMFHTFLVAFKKFNDFESVLKVLQDMASHGVRPDTYNWTVIAGMLAKDDPAKAERILKEMEKGLQADQDLPKSNLGPSRSRSGPVQRTPEWVPLPTIVTYTAILRGLIEGQRLHAAKKFAERIEATGCRRGTDERLDHVLEILEERLQRFSKNN